MAPKQMGDGSRKVRRDWRYVDPQTGVVSKWKAGDPYRGPMNNPHLDDPVGFDGKGPLLEPENPPPSAEKTPTDDSSKEK